MRALARNHRRPTVTRMTFLDLTPDEVLRTTRAVRKRLDFSRPVEDDVIRECVATAMQAPSGSNNMTMRFVVVKDEAKRKAIGEIYHQCFEIYKTLDGVYAGSLKKETEAEQAQQHRVTESALYLADHLGEAPAIVIACTAGRLDSAPAMMAVSSMGNVLPGTWSFMLAARARGLGTAWTTIALMQEQAVADVVGIPFAEVQQACLTPLAYTIGTDFKPAARPDPDTIIHWDTW
jgi:nitroreductase